MVDLGFLLYCRRHSALDLSLECPDYIVQFFSASLLPLLVDPIPSANKPIQFVVHPWKVAFRSCCPVGYVLLHQFDQAMVPFCPDLFYTGVFCICRKDGSCEFSCSCPHAVPVSMVVTSNALLHLADSNGVELQLSVDNVDNHLGAICADDVQCVVLPCGLVNNLVQSQITDCIHKEVVQLRVGSSLFRRPCEGPQAGFVFDMGPVVRSYKETLPALALHSDPDDLAV